MSASEQEVAKGPRGVLVAAMAVGVIAAGAGLYALTHSASSPPADAASVAAARAQAVTLMTLEPAQIARSLSVSGEARPVKDLRVYAPAAGVRVLAFLVDEGDLVNAGQPMARLDSGLANAQTLAAQAAAKEAQVAADRAKADFERAWMIRDSGALSPEQIDARKAQAEAAEARAAAARAQLAEVNARLQGGFVRAPAGGLVLSRSGELGAPVDGRPLFRIAGDNQLEVGVEVSEADMLAMKPGQRAVFRMIDGTLIDATLRRLPAAIDSKTRSGQAVFDLARKANLRAGMFLRGEAQLPEAMQLAAPRSAVVFDPKSAYVFVVGADNRAKKTPIQVGAESGDRVAILGGVAAGQKIIAAGAAFLQDGDLVRAVDTELRQTSVAVGEGQR
jgi:RND family efflux transporter MFP subunit